MSDTYPRDMVGYGRDWPHPEWPGGARIAVQSVLNYEEGTENCILHGDPASESLLTEFGFALPRQGERYLPVESQYEYGSRVGFWRRHRLFPERNVPVTVNAVAMALERNLGRSISSSMAPGSTLRLRSWISAMRSGAPSLTVMPRQHCLVVRCHFKLYLFP